MNSHITRSACVLHIPAMLNVNSCAALCSATFAMWFWFLEGSLIAVCVSVIVCFDIVRSTARALSPEDLIVLGKQTFFFLVCGCVLPELAKEGSVSRLCCELCSVRVARQSCRSASVAGVHSTWHFYILCTNSHFPLLRLAGTHSCCRCNFHWWEQSV
jgi:hypothetical protein